MIKYFFLFLFALNLYSQQKIDVINLKIDFEVPKNSKVSLKKMGNDNILTLISLTNTNDFKYLLTIIESDNERNVSFNDFKEQEYKDFYLEKCNCIIEDERVRNYNNLKSYQYKTKSRVEEKELYGYVDNFTKNEKVYAFIYLTSYNNFEKFKEEHKAILMTIKNR
ncbi:hypothetical protein [Tenacibaculum maritimum]|uniref:hypothetical protein n=1 Tax=Tenacibaculum maritimum TaxID=107401 RepID=UPI0012E402C5|nr:hypothetical protein [Tenacibaculum maritimum]CAA0241833.1 hypothetical protein FS0810_540001 [Tenacibaculum maritimum]